MVKLDAMENPYALPPTLRRGDRPRWSRALSLNRYPVPTARGCGALIARGDAGPRRLDVLLGNGSDEMHPDASPRPSRAPGAVVLAPEPSFVMFSMDAAPVSRMRYVGVPLRADFTLDVGAFLEAMRKEQARAGLHRLSRTIRPAILFGGRHRAHRARGAGPGGASTRPTTPSRGATFMPRLAEFPNLLVMRTVSKLGLAGLRLGLRRRPARVDRRSSTRCARPTTSTC